MGHVLATGSRLLDSRRLDFLVWEVEIGGIHIDLFDGEAGHSLHARHDVLTHSLSDLGNTYAILNGHVEVYRSLAVAYFDIDACGALVVSRDAPGNACNCSASAQWDKIVYSFDLTCGCPSNFGGNTIRDDGLPALGIQLDRIEHRCWEKLCLRLCGAVRVRNRGGSGILPICGGLWVWFGHDRLL